MASEKKPIQINARHHRMIRLIQRRREDDSGTPGEYNPKYSLCSIIEDLIEREAKTLNIVVPA